MRLVTATPDIEIRDGDVLLLECGEPLNMEQATMLKHRVRDVLGCDAIVFAGPVRLAGVMADAGTPIYDAVCALQAQ